MVEFFLTIKVLKRDIFKPLRKETIIIVINLTYSCIIFHKSLGLTETEKSGFHRAIIVVPWSTFMKNSTSFP